MSEPLKITKKIVGYRVVTPEETKGVQEAEQSHFEEAIDKTTDTLVEKAFVELLDSTVTEETIKPLDNSFFERIEALKTKPELKRPRQLSSETYRLKPPHAEHAIYVHISDIIYEGKKHLFEIFFNCKNPANIMWVSAITLLLSEAFREAIVGTKDLVKIVNNLKEVCDANGGYFAVVGEKKKHVGSLIAEVGYILEAHIQKCNAWNYSESSHERPATEEEANAAFTFNLAEMKQAMESPNLKLPVTTLIKLSDKEVNPSWDRESYDETEITNPCPECGEQLSLMDNCLTCVQGCGWSKCS